jgi:hypothetical protein
MVFVAATAEPAMSAPSKAEKQHAKKNADTCFQLNLSCVLNPIIC